MTILGTLGGTIAAFVTLDSVLLSEPEIPPIATIVTGALGGVFSVLPAMLIVRWAARRLSVGRSDFDIAYRVRPTASSTIPLWVRNPAGAGETGERSARECPKKIATEEDQRPPERSK
jgi:hypothetical protein